MKSPDSHHSLPHALRFLFLKASSLLLVWAWALAFFCLGGALQAQPVQPDLLPPSLKYTNNTSEVQLLNIRREVWRMYSMETKWGHKVETFGLRRVMPGELVSEEGLMTWEDEVPPFRQWEGWYLLGVTPEPGTCSIAADKLVVNEGATVTFTLTGTTKDNSLTGLSLDMSGAAAGRFPATDGGSFASFTGSNVPNADTTFAATAAKTVTYTVTFDMGSGSLAGTVYTFRTAAQWGGSWHLSDTMSPSTSVSITVRASKPSFVSLFGDNAPPTASLSASPASLVLGEATTLSLGQTLAAASGRHVDGNGLPGGTVAEPGASVSVTPSVIGSLPYSYTVPGGHVQLRWSGNTPVGQFVINKPDGTTFNATGRFFYNVTQSGAYTITQTTNLGSVTSPVLNVVVPAPAVATTMIQVLAKPSSGSSNTTVSLTPVVNAVVVRAPGRAYDGRSFARSWQEGEGWCAYLGRAGVRFACSGTVPAAGSVALELEARSCAVGAAWTRLATGSGLAGAGGLYSQEWLVRLGGVKADEPLVPESYARGAAETGQWHFRARVRPAGGDWSAWSEEVPVRVVLPVVVKSETLKTLPPVGPEGAWFTESNEKTFSISLWIP